MRGLNDKLMKIQIGGSLDFLNVTKGELQSISTMVSYFNGDFEKRQIDGKDTTLVLDRKRDEKNRCYHARVTRYEGILPKKGVRYMVPSNPMK